MGSFLSILNNTNDVWCVKIGPDEAAINIAAITTTVLGAVTATVATVGAAAPVIASLGADGVVTVYGVSTDVLAATTSAAAAVSEGFDGVASAADTATSVATLIQSKLSNDGFVRLSPGQTQQYGKLTLSLWQQCTCIRTRADPCNPKQIVVERVFMRPIFSGATDNSNLTHDIQFWINKNRIERINTIALP